MSKQVIIGIPAESRLLDNAYRNSVNQADVAAVVKAGGAPVLIPTREPALVTRYLDVIDGLLLPGGPDVAPRFYGEEPLPQLGMTDALLDESELTLVREAVKRGIPIFGICRGIQVINVALGGDLYQDIATQFEQPVLQHFQNAAMTQGTHHIAIDAQSRLAAIVQADGLLVNSHHHQSLKTVAPQLKVTATASDDAIEAVESVADDLIVAVQWHPETMFEVDAQMFTLFEDFVKRVERKSVEYV